jgi:hypothetical protein
MKSSHDNVHAGEMNGWKKMQNANSEKICNKSRTKEVVRESREKKICDVNTEKCSDGSEKKNKLLW